MTTVTMSDGKEVDFGEKRKALYNVTVNEDGSVQVDCAFRDGEYRSVTVDSGNENFAAFAAHGVKAVVAKWADSTAFDASVDGLLAEGPLAASRSGSGGAKLDLLGQALAEATGKTAEEIVAFLAGKDRSSRMAIRRDVRVAPILARLAEEAAAAKLAKKAAKGEEVEAPVDLLAGL